MEEEFSDRSATSYNRRQQTVKSRHVHKNKKSKVVCSPSKGTKQSVSKLLFYHTIKMDVLNYHSVFNKWCTTFSLHKGKTYNPFEYNFVGNSV